MENVVLVIHLLLALALIAVVLLQRSEGGGLGMGGGGGGGIVSSRGAATALGKITWALAIAFIATSLTLTVIAAQNAADSSVLDRLGSGFSDDGDADPLLPPAGALLPPPLEDSEPGTGVPLPRAE